MIPAKQIDAWRTEGIPRESGDDPTSAFSHRHSDGYSPRERG